ncbi:MAG: YMGG-like glycine zipper-containing protein [Hyphomonadaceae bacterium]
MKSKVLAAVFAGALALSACQTTSGGYGGGPPRTQLSQCTRNALIGAGIGAVIGATQGPRENRAENAAIGAAVGGLGTYGVCRWLTAREQQRVENAYYQSLNSGAAVNDTWQSDQGGTRSLQVARPVASDRGPECRRVSATIDDPQYGQQQLPPETFCRTPSGQWVPA